MLLCYATEWTRICILASLIDKEMSGTHLFFLELIDQILQQSVVKVLPTQEGVTIGGLDLEDASTHLQDGDIKGSTTQIKHSKGPLHSDRDKLAHVISVNKM